MRRLLRVIIPPTLTLLVALALWEAAVRVFDVPVFLLPAPKGVITAAVTHAEKLLRAALLTGSAALAGLALSAVVGVSVAVLIAGSRWVERSVYPFTVFLQTVPLVAVAPLLVVWSGNGLRSVTLSAFIVSLFPVIANTVSGLRSVDPALLDLFRLYRAGPMARLFKLGLPWSLPSLFTGLRVAGGLSVIGALVGEFVAGFAGDDASLGIVVMTCMREFKTDLMFAAIALASLLGLAIFALVNLLAYLLLRRWHASAQG